MEWAEAYGQKNHCLDAIEYISSLDAIGYISTHEFVSTIMTVLNIKVWSLI